MLTQSSEDYLKNIYLLQKKDAASTSDIARAMGVSSASVTNMIKRLAQMGLVEYIQYRGVKLTARGRELSLHLVRRHRLLELFLSQVLNYSWDQVHEEADKLEHHISATFEAGIDELLGNPTHDPHGDPIPTQDGELPESSAVLLSDIEPGALVVITQVSHDDPEFLRYLKGHGLMPNVKVQVLRKEPFGGPLVLKSGLKKVMIGFETATKIFVNPIEPPEKVD
jgi:DtxR family Mn-dependent transcriptional regulator